MIADRILRRLPPEAAHKVALKALSLGGGRFPSLPAAPGCSIRLFNENQPMMSRIGLAAGADKNGVAIHAWQRMGFGFAEIGTVTPLSRHGNDGTRMWRIGTDSMVNWLGLPNEGFLRVLDNIRSSVHNNMAVGLSIASPDNSRVELQWMAAAAAPSVDYLAYNVSCPNLGARSHSDLDDDLYAMVQLIVSASNPTPVLIKLAPEADEDTLRLTATRLINVGAKGFIACNTVRQGQRGMLGPLAPRKWPEHNGHPVGGYSGPGLYPIAKRMVEILRSIDNHAIVIGCGGIQTPEALRGMLEAGADAVQVYTGVARHGIGLLHDLLDADRKISPRAELEVIADFDETLNKMAAS